MTNEYQAKIQSIIEAAMTEQTFSLEIINRIKELNDGFISATKEIEVLEKKLQTVLENNGTLNAQLCNANTKLRTFEERESKLIEREKSADRLEWERNSATSSKQEIKELVSMVFRNPVLKFNQSGNLPNGVDQYGNSRSGYMNKEETQIVA